MAQNPEQNEVIYSQKILLVFIVNQVSICWYLKPKRHTLMHTTASRLNEWLKANTGPFHRSPPTPLFFSYQLFASPRSNSPSLFKQQPFWIEPYTSRCLQKATTEHPGPSFPRRTIKASQQTENTHVCVLFMQNFSLYFLIWLILRGILVQSLVPAFKHNRSCLIVKVIIILL